MKPMCEVIVSILRLIRIWGDAAVLGKTDRWQKTLRFSIHLLSCYVFIEYSLLILYCF